MPLAFLGLGAVGLGALSEKYGWTFIPNYKDIPTVMTGNDDDLEQRAFNLAKTYLIANEGKRNYAYKDSRGILTVGIGHKIIPSDKIKLGDYISDARVNKFFETDVNAAFEAAIKQAKTIDRYNVEMIARLTEVNFQLGIYWTSKFPNTWALIKTGTSDNVRKAVSNILSSDWAEQTPNRALNFAQTLQKQFLA